MSTRTKSRLRLKRAYEKPSTLDGRRVLVDRIWPRGVTKKELRLDTWIKDLAPSTALRKWFGHDPARWRAFKSRYFQELDEQPGAVARVAALWRIGVLTLVFSAKDTHHNHAVALKDYLEQSAKRSRRMRNVEQHVGMTPP